MDNYRSTTDSKTTTTGLDSGLDSHPEKSYRGTRPSRTGSDVAGQDIKMKVENAIATVAGVVDGFVEQMRETELAEHTKEAIEITGEAAHKIVTTSKREFKRTVEAIRGEVNLDEGGITDNATSTGSSGYSGSSFGSDRDVTQFKAKGAKKSATSSYGSGTDTTNTL